MEAIGQLAGGIAHDLNNALTAVVGYTELALAELAEGHPARQDVDEIRRAAGRAASVARQLLAFSRKQMLEPRLLDINAAINGLARLLRTTLGENVTLRTVLTPGLPAVMGDAGQVEQAIVNLAVNARDAMPHGGQVVIVTTVEDVTDEFARVHAPMPSGRYAVVSVTDTGHGMDRDTQARIFEPFFTTKSVGKGTGLGLTMVYGTMKQCGGFVFVESAVGRGATFRLYFPPVGPDKALAAGASDAPAPSTKTVLVVDDEPAILKLVTTALGVDGYRIFQAASGPEALEVANAYDGAIDLIVTDATMPAMGGVELAHKLLARRPGLAVIVMSGYTQDLSGMEATGRSISTLQKPFTPMELRAKVRNALRSSEA
jgi:CheY-like chemotaxis protein